MSSEWDAYLDLRLDRITILPIVPNRLAFSVFVRRALAAMESERDGALNGEDVIAVALPSSMQDGLHSAIAALPKISLIVSRAHPQEAREVFGVTPGDGMVEAVRWAGEHKVPLRLVDREVAAGNVLERDCSPDLGWADDDYALECGATAYLNLVSRTSLRAPRRREPVDTWREVFMALELRRLCARFRRVVFLCQAPHARPICDLLSGGARLREWEEEPGRTVQFDVLQPSLQVLLRYLDDIPRLVERFERARRSNGDLALSFDKRKALLEVLRDWSGELAEGRPSPRQLRAFCRLLPAQLRSAGRLAPRLADCAAVADCCFDLPLRRALRDHLVGYFDQIEARRVGLPVSPIPGEAPSRALDESGFGPLPYVARGCNPAQQTFAIEPPGPPGVGNPFVWPLWTAHHNAMRRKVYLAARSLHPIALTREYRGSIEQGINFRRTLASYFRGDRQIFVHRTLRRRRTIRPDRPEPIVWVFAEPGTQPVVQSRHVQARRDQDQFYGLFLLAYEDKRTVYAEAQQDGGRIVELCDAVGAASFYDLGISLESARKTLGRKLKNHLPPLTRLSGTSFQPETWLDGLVGLAVEFAEERIYCVASEELEISLPLQRNGKEILRVPAERLGLRAFAKLSSYCIVDGGDKTAIEATDEFYEELIARYEEVVDTKWP